MTAHIRRKRAVLFLNCSFYIYIVKRSSRFRISRIMLSATAFCVLLSRHIFSPLWNAISTTVSTSKAMARNKSSLACYNAVAWICGTMAASFCLRFFPLSVPFLPGVLRLCRRVRPMFCDIPNCRRCLYDNRLTDWYMYTFLFSLPVAGGFGNGQIRRSEFDYCLPASFHEIELWRRSVFRFPPITSKA